MQFLKFDTQNEKAVLFDGSKPYVHWSDPVGVGIISYMNIYWVSDKSSHSIKVEEGRPFSFFKTEGQWTCPGDITWDVLKDPIYNISLSGQNIDGQYWYQLQLIINTDVAGEYICDLNIDDEEFSVGAQVYEQDESLRINLANQGIEMSNIVGRAIYDADPHNESVDYILLNRKFKELLLNYMDVHGNKGSYNSLFNSLKWFEYGNLVQLREVWRYLTPDGAKYFDRSIQQWFTEEVRKRYFNSARTTSLYLRHLINQIDTVDTSADGNMVPLNIIINKGVKEIIVNINGSQRICAMTKVIYVPKGENVTWTASSADHYTMNQESGSLTIKDSGNVIDPTATPVLYDLQIIVTQYVKSVAVTISGVTTVYTSSTTVKAPYDTYVSWDAEAKPYYHMLQETGYLRIKEEDNVISPEAEPNEYELVIELNSNVRKVVVVVDGQSIIYTRSTTRLLPYGTQVSWTAEADQYYTLNQSSGSLTIKDSGNIISPTAQINKYTLKIIVNEGVKQIVVNGGEATGTYTTSKEVQVSFKTSVSWTATPMDNWEMNQDQSQGSLTIVAGENIISPTAKQSLFPLHIIVNQGVASIKVITSDAAGTYTSGTTTKSLPLGSKVSWSATPQTSNSGGWTLSSTGGTVTIIAGDNYINPTATFLENTVVTPKFEYANFTVSWTDGSDLDIWAGVVSPSSFVGKNGNPISFTTRGPGIPSYDYMGFGSTRNNSNGGNGVYTTNNFGEWTFDDTSSRGAEGIYLNFSKESDSVSKNEAGFLFNEGIQNLLAQGIKEIQFDIWDHWYAARGTNNLDVSFELFQDGKMVRSGNKYVNQGGERVMNISRKVPAPTVQQQSADGEGQLLLTFKYNIETGQATITFRD